MPAYQDMEVGLGLGFGPHPSATHRNMIQATTWLLCYAVACCEAACVEPGPRCSWLSSVPVLHALTGPLAPSQTPLSPVSCQEGSTAALVTHWQMLGPPVVVCTAGGASPKDPCKVCAPGSWSPGGSTQPW